MWGTTKICRLCAAFAGVLALATLAPSTRAAEPSSTNFLSRGGHFGAGGRALATSTAPSGRFAGSGTAIGHPLAGGFSGSLSDLTTNAPGYWALFIGQFPSLDFDGDGLQGFRDDDDDGDGLLDVVETNTGVFLGAGDTGSDPYSTDTDADGYGDAAEVAAASNPNDPFSFPGAVVVPGLGLLGSTLLWLALGKTGAARLRHVAPRA